MKGHKSIMKVLTFKNDKSTYIIKYDESTYIKV